MKKSLILVLAIFIASNIGSAQIEKTISTEAGYVNENYYSLETETEFSITRDDWDLALGCNGIGFGGSAIRINGANGCHLYFYEDGIDGWDAVSITGFDFEANERINPSDTWIVGAFGNAEQASFEDLGWGTYNSITHTVNGDRIFILQLADETYKKLIIETLQAGVYSFKYADIDGSNEVTETIAKADYPERNFAYYSIQNNETIDREPATSSWDLLFTKYVVDLGDNTYYGVSGVLANVNTKVAQANGVSDVNTESFIGQDYTFDIGTLGYDWKVFNNTTFTYDVIEDVVYFVETPALDVYRIIFTGFGGSANGDFIFTQELVGSTVDIQENMDLNSILSVYPNPSNDVVNLTYIGSDSDSQVIITDLTGKQVYTKQINNTLGLNQEVIEVNNFTNGIYFLSLVSGNKISTQKIIIE